MKDKILRQHLFGVHDGLAKRGRLSEMYFPAGEDGERPRSIRYRLSDGVVLYFLKRIEALEEDVRRLKTSSKR